MLIQSTFLFGFEHSLNYFFNKFKSEIAKKTLVSTQVIFILLNSTIFSVVAIVAFSDKLKNLNLILLWAILSVMGVYFIALLKVSMRVSAFIQSQLLQSFSLLMLVYIFFISYTKSLQGIIYANIFSLVLSTLFMYCFVRNYLGIIFSVNLLKKVLTYGLPLMPSGALLWASMQLDRYFILHYIDKYSLGIYSLSLTVVMIPLFLKNAVKSAIDPFIMKNFHNTPDKTRVVISDFFTLSLLTFGFIFLLLSFFSHEIVVLMGGTKYIESIHYIPWLLLIACLTTCNQYFVYGINFSKRNALILKGLIYMLAINVVLMWLLIKTFDIYGVIFSNLFANIFYTSYIFKKSNELYFINYKTKNNLIIVISAIILFFINVLFLQTGFIIKLVSLFLFIIINIKTFKISKGVLRERN